MEREIGGYLNLELSPKASSLHQAGFFVNSGRHAIEYCIRTIPNMKKIWLPYFTCRVVSVLEQKMGIQVERYHINRNLEIADEIILGDNEYLLVTNYFGIKDAYIDKLAKKYGNRLIIDNAHALFKSHIPGTMTAYSPRKVVGIPDGGIAFTCFPSLDVKLEYDMSYDRCSAFIKRYDLGSAAGYADSKECNKAIEKQPLKKMSRFTSALYNSIDFDRVKAIRRNNFRLLHDHLCFRNAFKIPEMGSFECPLIYPYISKDEKLKDFLISNGIFVATYWPFVIDNCHPDSVEVDLARHIVALPIDQRYGEEEMNFIIEKVDEYER